MFQLLKDQTAFFRQFRQQFETTGAIAPSSRFLAKSMTRYLAQRGDAPIRVLEIGPGTGPVTNRIVRLIRPGDTFDLVELNDEFVRILNQRFESDSQWSTVRQIAQVHQIPVQDYQSDQPYDIVISGLPLNNFPADLVETIAGTYLRLLKVGGTLSYFEYMYVRPVRRIVTRGPEKERITRIDDIMQKQCDDHRIRRDSIWFNVPPAWVQHLKKTDESES